MARRIAIILALVLGVYLFFAASRGLDLLRADDPAVKALGIAVLILPILGGIVLIREIRFGRTTFAMGQEIDVEYLPLNGLTDDQKKENLDVAINRAKNDIASWQSWYAVAIAYDLLSERKLAREAMRHAVELHQLASPK
jgi:hypothetical protein